MSEKTIYDVERAKFNGFGTYKLPIEERVNEIIEATKKEYPNMDNYLLWLCAVDYVLEEKGLKKDNERKIFIYKSVSVEDDDVHVVALLIMVNPDTYNDVFIETPALFKRMASQFP